MKRNWNWRRAAAGLLAAAWLAGAARAQNYTVTPLLGGGTNATAANSTNTYALPLTLTRHDDAALYLAFRAGAAGASNVVFVFEQSVDGTNYGTADRWRISVPANGTNLVGYATNVAVRCVGYLRLAAVENGFVGTYLTNLTVKAAVKPRRNG